MANTYDPENLDDAGYVRLLISDTDTTTYHFEDEEINAFLSETQTTGGTNQVKLAAALALRAWAAYLTRTTGQVKTATFARDNRHRAQEMIALAERYEEEALDEPAGGVAEQAVTDEVAVEIYYNQQQR